MSFPPPVFILAPPRSFTSVVCGMIGQHPQVFGMPELNLFQADTVHEFWTGQRASGTMRQPFWKLMRHGGILRAIAELYAGEQTIDSIEMAKRWVAARLDRTTAEAHYEICAKAAPQILLDKSPGYVRKREYLDRIVEAFPDARFIHLVRHPRGLCESVIKAEGGALTAFFLGAIDRTVDPPVVDPQIAWRDAQFVILRFLADLPADQWTRVRGEDFIRDPVAGAVGICRWLGISDAPDAIEEMKHPERSPFAHIGPANARLGNDPNFLESPELRPARVKEQSLDGALSWRPDERGFRPEVVELARYFGYR
ncbi:MAG: sulfotransferase [Parvularculaceae bacterium]